MVHNNRCGLTILNFRGIQMFKIYPIFTTLVDVFQGDGWENWTRIRKVKGQWQIVRGLSLSSESLASVTKEL